ncbi:DEAD/DEAH box helicase [Gilvimarinus xylanilyticus]|uniref:DEAD/DEAH box helicase n=1 Tax=Gilvimarinus xylanilyticus TaxID=2944139 RepID=A0A9X2KTU3_9GAMM|nr:DEAD/DEAH box helicase [Gilvimarinus xylanilyticus]MCP8899143.1 DEAD/DEAH box helicase [Gilvimarinus xylanilyticus]
MSELTSFAGIEYAPLLAALSSRRIIEPTPVQQAAIEPVLDGADVLVSAPTGSGKTLAFVLPVLELLQARKAKKQVRALVLTPTRELARQIVGEARKLCEQDQVNVVAVTGGDHKQTQSQYMQAADFLVATPGRLAEYVAKGEVDLSGLEFLVVDEADRTLDMGFSEALTQIALACNPERQTLIYSATVRGRQVLDFIQVITNPETLETVTIESQSDQREQRKVLVDDPDHVARLLPALLQQVEYRQAIVFVNKKERAQTLAGVLQSAGFDVALLHGDIDARRRKLTLQAFNQGRAKVLLSTDLAARGLDIPAVELVVNAELPFNVPSFIHRAGRTARAGREGTVVSLVSAHTWDLMASIEQHLGAPAKLMTVPGFEAHYKGPKKVKSSGKAAGGQGAKAAKKKKSAKKADKPKLKKRARDQKNLGKRRKPAPSNK